MAVSFLEMHSFFSSLPPACLEFGLWTRPGQQAHSKPESLCSFMEASSALKVKAWLSVLYEQGRVTPYDLRVSVDMESQISLAASVLY